MTRTRRWTSVALAAALLLSPTAAWATPPDDADPTAARMRALAPTAEIADAYNRVLTLAEDAEAAVVAHRVATAAAAQARTVEILANSRATAAEVRTQGARDALGEYAAAAYISGGPTADLSAALKGANPAEMISRRAALGAVADVHTDLIRELRAAQDELVAARAAAQQATQAALDAQGQADAAAKAARDAAVSARQEFNALVAATLAAQPQEVSEALLRARAAAFALGDGAGLLTADGVPTEYVTYGNGQVPTEALAPVGDTGQRLWPRAAYALELLLAAADTDGVRIAITDSYRPLSVQEQTAAVKGLWAEGGLAAVPGTSHHGWGLAVDLDLDEEALTWMRANAAAFGFLEDTPREPWHWKYVPIEGHTPPAPPA